MIDTQHDTVIADSFQRSLFQKIFFTITSIHNWYMLPIDKYGVRPKVTYYLKGGLKFIARSKSTDINEMIAILTGLIYPKKFVTCKQGDVIVDLGASCGEFVLFAHAINKGVKIKGYAVEPYLPNITALKENISLNRIKNFAVIPVAISDKNGYEYLNTDTSFDNIRISKKKTGVKSTALTVPSLAKKHNITNISILKMDIEGHEYEVIKHSYKFILKSTKRILLEYHNLDKKRNVKTLLKMFQNDYNITFAVKASHGGIMCLENKSFIK